jgi:hypothetical protein
MGTHICGSMSAWGEDYVVVWLVGKEWVGWFMVV